jgi:hypothetical protein
MSALTPAERDLLRAVADAPDVARPLNTELKVGDTVVTSGERSASTRTVKTVGRTWITVTGFRFRFRRDTWRSAIGHGPECRLMTVEQRDYDLRLRVARDTLRDAGVSVSYVSPPPDGRILAIAALLDLLDGSGPSGADREAALDAKAQDDRIEVERTR